MKTQIMVRINDPVKNFFKGLGYTDSTALNLSVRLRKYNIHTVRQMIGAFCPSVPEMTQKQIRKKGLTCSPRTIITHKNPDYVVTKIKNVLKLTRNESRIIYNTISYYQGLKQSYHFNFNWALGGRKTNTTTKRINFWHTARKVRIAKGFHVIPQYNDSGNIFDQGERGTCVANATCTLLDYKSNSKSSRQFLYHQCKMIDGMPDSEGTFLDLPFKLLDNNNFTDRGCVNESVWPYNPNQSNEEHQGPPPENAFNCKRILHAGTLISPRSEELISDIKYLLNNDIQGKTCPVVCGVPLFESFFSFSTSKTGWVTLPLPSESVIGYHAMIIVGYDEDRSLFLVRNSWGSRWASENDKGFSGHAWIPYEYIKKYAFEMNTLETVHSENVNVPLSERLYNKSINAIPRRIAALKKKKVSTKKIRKRDRSVPIFRWLIRASIILILWNAFHEPVKRFALSTYDYINSKIDIAGIQKKAQDYLTENLFNE